MYCGWPRTHNVTICTKLALNSQIHLPLAPKYTTMPGFNLNFFEPESHLTQRLLLCLE